MPQLMAIAGASSRVDENLLMLLVLTLRRRVTARWELQRLLGAESTLRLLLSSTEGIV